MSNTILMRRVRRLGVGLMLATALGLLAACGGSGNGGVRATPQTPPPPTTPVDQPPIDIQLTATNTDAAHAAGYTGAGVTIGIVDSGIMRSNPTVAGRVTQSLIYVDPKQNNTRIDDVIGHGTWVSEIAAGQAFDSFPGGIAPGANLISARIIADAEPKDDGSGQGNRVTAADADWFAQVLVPDLIQAGVQVMNNSWGGLYWDTTDASINKAFGDAYAPFVQAGGLVVFAAGNESRANPSDFASLPNFAPAVAPGWLVAVALDSNHLDKLADYSNACGRAMDYCLAAPGDVIVLDKDATTSTADPKYYIVSGTSLAAPQITGAAALVWQAFPYFNNDLVRQTLLGTADDLGAVGVDPVFGHGLLNVGRAVQGPAKFDWGNVSVSFDTITSNWANDISGAGGLIKDGSGVLVLEGQNSYTGRTQVLGGYLQSWYDLPGDVSTGVSGTLIDVPGVAGNLDNAGTLVVRGGDTTVGGNFTQSSTGTLSVNLGSLLGVTGTATLDGGLNVLGAESGYVKNSHENVLTASGGVTGTFAQLTTSPGVFLSTTIQYTPNSVWLDTSSLNITATATAMGITAPAALAAATHVQRGFEAINRQLASGITVSPRVLRGAGAIQRSDTATVAGTTLNSLSGQLHAASAAMLFKGIDATAAALSGHLDDALDGVVALGAWYANLGWQGDLQRSGYSGANFRSGGGLVGSDFRVGTRALFGYAVGASQGAGQLDGAWDHNRIRTEQALLYGGFAQGPWYASARLGSGQYREDMQRLLQLGALAAPVASSATGRYVAGALESGWQLRAGNLRLTPFVDLRYQRLAQGAFAEDGGYGFGLAAANRAIARSQAGVGVRADSAWRLANGMFLQWDGSASLRRVLAESGAALDARFTAIDAWMPVDGIGLSRQESMLSTGLSLWPTSAFGVRLGYTREQGTRQRADSMMLQGALAF